MDKKKCESDDDYWERAHKGFDFGATDSPFGVSKLSASLRKNDKLNQFDLLKCDGLNEVAENEAVEQELGFSIVNADDIFEAKKPLAFNVLSTDEDKNGQKLRSSFNPLELRVKKGAQNLKFSAADTIKSMILGLEYSLEPFKGKEEKVELLALAVKSHDGNAILTVILFLRSTLKKLIFQREIVMYPDAVNVYLSYLEEDHETDELANMLLLLDKPDDAAILKYEAAVTVENPERKLKWIENCLSTHFQPGAMNPFLSLTVAEHRRLLEEQLCLEKLHNENARNETDAINIFEKLTGRKSVIDSSVMCSLIFCCLYYYKITEPRYASPVAIKSSYNVSSKQYTWATLRALAATKKWRDVNDLFISKNWLGGVKMRSCIGFPRVVETLSRMEAPNEILVKYVSCIEDEDQKVMLAKKYKCHSVVIEILKNSKDRLGLIAYKAELLPHSVDFCTVSDFLNNPLIKWRN